MAALRTAPHLHRNSSSFSLSLFLFFILSLTLVMAASTSSPLHIEFGSLLGLPFSWTGVSTEDPLLLFSFLLLLGFVALVAFLWGRKDSSFMPSLEDKHVFVTGGSSGIGFSIAEACLRQGAFVTLVARNSDRLVSARKCLIDSTHCSPERIFAKAADVSDAKSIREVVEEAIAWRPVDVLICNAGVAGGGLLCEVNAKELERVFQINLLGSMYPVHAALPSLKKRSRSHPTSIVFVNSTSGLAFCVGALLYSSTKYAQRGLANALNLELLPYNIKVSLSCPNFTETPMLDLTSDFDRKKMKIFQALHGYKRETAQSAEEVALKIVEGFKRGELFITTDFNGYFLGALSRGVFPSCSFARNLMEALCLIPFRVLTLLSARGIRRMLNNPRMREIL